MERTIRLVPLTATLGLILALTLGACGLGAASASELTGRAWGLRESTIPA